MVTILVDVMDTLVVEPYWVDMPAWFGMTPAELRAAQHPTAWIAFEEGRLDEAEYLRRFFADGRPVEGDALRAFLRAHYRWMPGAEDWLAALADAGHEIHALSNYPVWFELIEDALQLSRYLSWSFVSCNTGVRKPDPASFHGPLESLGLPPHACLFIDDRPVNIRAASALGIPALLADDADSLRRELHALDLIR